MDGPNQLGQVWLDDVTEPNQLGQVWGVDVIDSKTQITLTRWAEYGWMT